MRAVENSGRAASIEPSTDLTRRVGRLGPLIAVSDISPRVAAIGAGPGNGCGIGPREAEGDCVSTNRWTANTGGLVGVGGRATPKTMTCVLSPRCMPLADAG